MGGVVARAAPLALDPFTMDLVWLVGLLVVVLVLLLIALVLAMRR